MRSPWFSLMLVLAAACNNQPSPELEDPGPGCTTDPSACPPDTTCWPVDISGRYDCLPAPKDQAPGAPCTIDFGQPDCAAGAFCYPTAPSSGICSPVCASNADCGGSLCIAVHMVGAQFRYDIHVCQVSSAADAGTD